jgi:hypothetical protein
LHQDRGQRGPIGIEEAYFRCGVVIGTDDDEALRLRLADPQKKAIILFLINELVLLLKKKKAI